jgi:hypothetical protein
MRDAQQGAAHYSGYPDAGQHFATHAGTPVEKAVIIAAPALVNNQDK